ncbi:hypothetical protein O181_089451 [Austropuccinia psidii MF-1]|uniref:Uncharacterized protein n=1 Tax=Austropuccinia psidii MF-1 TaxID=1389203 RepID=A0A9Q3ITL8_9BASI|nr:hypothetical protein [Austropuccinia psidii MF-1]
MNKRDGQELSRIITRHCCPSYQYAYNSSLNKRYTNLASSPESLLENPTSGRKTFKDYWSSLMNTDTGGSLIGLELFGPTSRCLSLARNLIGCVFGGQLAKNSTLRTWQ